MRLTCWEKQRKSHQIEERATTPAAFHLSIAQVSLYVPHSGSGHNPSLQRNSLPFEGLDVAYMDVVDIHGIAALVACVAARIGFALCSWAAIVLPEKGAEPIN